MSMSTPSLALPTASDLSAAERPLSQWLKLLWNQSPALHLDSELPFITAGSIHLPSRSHWRAHRAAAAHAAAHLVYSPARFESAGLVPIARALLGLLEDARVEALAMRELPGLARLWRPLHSATPDDTPSSAGLMARLARALADPDYDDPHPWVAKGRRLFYLDETLALLALRTPAELRTAAMRLGHDIGQMRLPFNAKGPSPLPAYRDDHRWMWNADQLSPVQPPPEPMAAEVSSAFDPPEEADEQHAVRVTHVPEWDHRIGRLRADWCRVIEHDGAASVTGSRQSDSGHLALSRQLLAPLGAMTRRAAARSRSHEGEVFDLDALVHWRIARRLRLAGDARVYRGTQRSASRSRVWLLVDRSASTASTLGAQGSSGKTVLQTAAQAAAAIALALQTLGVHCAVAAFCSSGRHAVRMHTVKHVSEHADETLAARLQALRSGGSTRLGAVLRHALARLGSGSGGARWVLVLSDGEPHDIDIHDPRYLAEDARQAVRQAARHAVHVACLTLAEAPNLQVQRIFGPRGAQRLSDAAALPRALQRLRA